MRFKYQARSEDGQINSGMVNASSKEEAVSILQKNGLYVSFVEEEVESIYSKKISLFEKISRKDVVLFSRQLAIMFQAGVPIVESLESIAAQVKKEKFKEQISKVAEKVESGNALSQALNTFPKTFPSFYIGMVKSGEISGRLSETLQYLADHMEREYEFNSKVIGSLVYPLFVFFVFISILFFMVVFVIPGLIQVFEGMELPFLTQVVINISYFTAKWWWIPFSLFILLFVFGARFIKTEKGKIVKDKIILKTPLVSDFSKKVSLVRIAENLSTLIAGGLPIVQAIEITSEVVGSHTYREIMLETRNGVRKGESISSVLIKYPEYFPSLFIQMVTVGEKTGRVDSALKNVVTFYQGEIERTLNGLVRLMEPVMLIFLGAIVGLFVVSILMPIYQMSF